MRSTTSAGKILPLLVQSITRWIGPYHDLLAAVTADHLSPVRILRSRQ
jgi:hypothetical protein